MTKLLTFPVFRVYNGLAPTGLPKAITVTYPMPAGLGVAFAVSDDLVLETSLGLIEYVQGVWVDNADNDSKVTIQLGTATLQRIVISSRSQGVYPIIADNPLKYTLSSVGMATAININLMWLNVPTALHHWGV